MSTFHIICAGPSAQPWISKIDWCNKSVVLCNGTPLIFNRQTKDTRWVMIDDIPEALKFWTQGLNDAIKYCTDINKHDVLGGYVIKHNVSYVSDNPLVSGFFWQGSVGNLACHLAQWLGATKCYVWGLDYQDKTRSYSHIHDSLKSETNKWKNMDNIEVGWQKTRTGLHDLGCEIYNCNPNSVLQALEIVDPDKAAKED